MQWFLVLGGYIVGAFPTAYIFGQKLKGKDIRQMGDRNMGARNAYHEIGHKIGILIFCIDTAKGSLGDSDCPLFRRAAIYFTGYRGGSCGRAQLAGFFGVQRRQGRSCYHWNFTGFNPRVNINCGCSDNCCFIDKKECNINQRGNVCFSVICELVAAVQGILVFYGIALPVMVATDTLFPCPACKEAGRHRQCLAIFE